MISSGEARISLQPKQKLFLDLILGDKYSWVGFGGAKGGSKSAGLQRILVALMFMFPGIAMLLVRRTYDEVLSNHVRKIIDAFPWMSEHYRKSDKLFEIPCDGGKTSRLQIGYGENEGDVMRYNGMDDFALVAVDQAEQFPESDLHILKSCNRTLVRDFKPKLALTFNPGGPSHAYLKRLFVEPREFQRNERADDYAPLVQAYGWDNVEWVRGELEKQGLTATDYYSWDEEKRKEWFLESDYGRDLLGLDPPLPSYYLWGDWNVFAGKYFSRFDRDKHTVDPDEMALKPWYHRWISVDIGFAHPTAIYWHCFDGKSIWTYREYVAAELEADEIGRVIVQESMLGLGPNGLPVMENISEVYLSPDGFTRKTSSKTQAQAMGDVLAAAQLPRPRVADDNRVDGWRLMARSMNDGTWKISRSCERLIKRIPQAQRKDDNLEDVKKFDGDDELDSARYGLKSYQRAEREPVEMRMAAAVNDPDPTMAYQQWIQFQAKERLSGARVIDLSAYRRGGGRLSRGGPWHA